MNINLLTTQPLKNAFIFLSHSLSLSLRYLTHTSGKFRVKIAFFATEAIYAKNCDELYYM